MLVWPGRYSLRLPIGARDDISRRSLSRGEPRHFTKGEHVFQPPSSDKTAAVSTVIASVGANVSNLQLLLLPCLLRIQGQLGAVASKGSSQVF